MCRSTTKHGATTHPSEAKGNRPKPGYCKLCNWKKPDVSGGICGTCRAITAAPLSRSIIDDLYLHDIAVRGCIKGHRCG